MTELAFSTPIQSHIAAYPPGASFGPRRLRDWEFVWMIEGDAVYQRAGKTYAAPEGSLVLCRPGATDSFVWDTKRRTRHGFFHFQISRTPAAWPAQNSWPVVRSMEASDVLRPLLGHILTWNTRSDQAQKRAATALLLAAFVSGDVATQNPVRAAWPESVERAWQQIQARVEDGGATSLEDLARAACVSSEHLCRVFRAVTGRAPMETLRLARLDRAAQLLARSNFPIAEIAQLCGFASPFHFSRSFRAAFALAPRELRAAARAGQMLPAPLLYLRFD